MSGLLQTCGDAGLHRRPEYTRHGLLWCAIAASGSLSSGKCRCCGPGRRIADPRPEALLADQSRALGQRLPSTCCRGPPGRPGITDKTGRSTKLEPGWRTMELGGTRLERDEARRLARLPVTLPGPSPGRDIGQRSRSAPRRILIGAHRRPPGVGVPARCPCSSRFASRPRGCR